MKKQPRGCGLRCHRAIITICRLTGIKDTYAKRALRKDLEPEDEVPDIKLDWEEVKAAQGMKRSVWSGLKRAAT
ncbi:28S ribosomal protein S5, mitochondrial [Heterocephalus glaber]|uniref:28S ribosomal protein S5, mitochondrial n=1 Tax=Heterocephalus glaber TaxID=10181 RepID=G5ALK4_HETGA|nr:28S ribosomal protein S5, mitochondrial [Heterocephalus glaber]